MKKSKIEFILRDILSNIFILIIFANIILISFNENNRDVLSVSNSEYNGTIYAGDKNSNKISLMINVYWGNEYVEKMLEIFKTNNIKTTFFVGGSWASENQELLKKIYDDGHEIASHGYSHKEQGKLDYDSNYSEIFKTHRVVKNILNIDMNLFAPPGGSYNSNTTKSASDLGYKTIMWTRDTIDWRDHDANLIYNRAVTLMQGGDLILIHPTESTTQALPKIIEYARCHELKITTVSDAIWLKC